LRLRRGAVNPPLIESHTLFTKDTLREPRATGDADSGWWVELPTRVGLTCASPRLGVVRYT